MSKINQSVLNQLYSTKHEVVEQAFNMLYNEYSYLVYYVSLKIIKDKDLASEITNETFYQFLLHKKEINTSKNIKYYLLTTSKNLSINYINKYGKIECLQDYDQVAEKKDDFNRYIEEFKDFLNEEEIELIVYHFLYGFSFKDIAAELKVSVNAVSSKYQRTIQKVKKYYKGV